MDASFAESRRRFARERRPVRRASAVRDGLWG